MIAGVAQQPDFSVLAAEAMAGLRETLWLAVYNHLNRHPLSLAECEQAMRELPPAELALYVQVRS